MKVVETAQIPAKQFEEAIWSREQYLDTARGHYLSALAGLSGGKQEQTKISHSSDSSLLLEDYAFNQAAEAERASTPGQQGQVDTFSDMDLRMRLPNGVLKACEKDFRAVKLQLDKTLARSTKCQITEMFCKLGSFGKEMDMNDAADLNITRIVSSEPDDVKEPLPKTVIESSSLHRMVESLKAELESLKKEHVGLNEIDAGAEFAARNLRGRLPKTKPEKGGCLAKRDKTGHFSEEVTHDKDEVNDLKIKAKGLKREHDATKVSTNVEKRPKIALDVDEAKEGAVSALNQAKSSPEGIFSAYVSTSESSARVMISEDEHDSSSQQVGKSAKLEGATLAAAMEGVEEGKCVDAPEFSIRDFVFSARNKDISLNWPFSQKNLQLCLQHGVKNVLPPFQPMDSLKESSIKRCSAEESLHSEESTLEEKASTLKNHHVPGNMLELDHSWGQELAEGYRDSVSLPIGGERDLAFKSIATANSHSEVESVSTSNLPLSEVSDEREAAASAANNKTKSSASQLSNKKCKVAIKMRINSNRNTPEDITSACTVPSEVISSKICPVCENFSSSSNTTLNAHIDQCLSSQSPPIWVKSSKLVKPRIKPRKMRLMSDICATAPSCTLEDLDRRNGTNWATNVDFPLEDADVPAEQNNPRVSSRYIINNVDDGSVYIDSSGRKIRILSKLNDTPSFSKAREIVRPKKQSKKGKRSKFFSPNKKKRLTKHLKYLKVTHQRKRFSSLKVKGRSTEACGAEEAILAVGSRHKEQHQSASYVKELKAHKPNHPGVEGIASQWIPLKNSNMLQKNDSEVTAKLSRNENQAETASLIGNDQVGSFQVEPRGTPAKMHLNLPKRSLSSMQSKSSTPAMCPAEVDQRSGGSCRGNTDGPLLRSAVRGNREVCQVSLKLGARGSTTFPAPPEREVDRQQNSLQNADLAFSCSRKLLHSSHVGPSKGVRSRNSKTNIFSPIHSSVNACQANSQKTGLAFETSCSRSLDKETEAWSADASQQSGIRVGYPKNSSITDSLRRSSAVKVRQKQASKHQDGQKGTNRSDELADDTYGNPGCVSYFLKGPHNEREFMASETRGNLGDPGLSDEREMFYKNLADAERSEIKTGDEVLNFGHGSLFPEVDPIPIPGPPGSDLPCFSDMGSEDRGSLSSCLAQPSGDGDDVVDRDLSEPPSFATSTNLGRYRNDDLTANEKKSLSGSLLVPDNVYSGWLGACSGPFSTVSSQFTAADVERVTCVNSSEKGLLNCDYQQCCSQKEEITHSSINSEEPQLLGWRPISSRSKHGYTGLGGQVNNLNDRSTVFSTSSYHQLETSRQTTVQAADPFLRNGEYDSSSPSAPILRLMGKDLMVSNKVDTDLSRSQASINVGMNIVKRSWELQPTQNPTCMKPLLHGQDPHCLPVRHVDLGSSNVIHNFRSHDQASGGMYNYDRMHASFSVLGAGPLQR